MSSTRAWLLTVYLTGPFTEHDYPFVPLEATTTRLARMRELLQEGVFDDRDGRWYPPHRIRFVSMREAR